MLKQYFVAVLVCVCSRGNAQTAVQARPPFELLGQYKSIGGLVATTVAEGPVKGSQRLYASYLYADNTLDVVAIDPADGKAEVFHNPARGEYGARNIAIGPDGDVYLGSLPHAHFLRVDRKDHRMIDLGRPSPSEEYIWDVAFGADHRLYGVTYPGCRLVRYDPGSGKLEDLGKMDPTEKYGRWIVGGRDQFMYIGLGTSKANIAVFNTRTGELREILPKDAQVVGIAKPYTGVDGKIYASLNDRLFQMSGFDIHEMPSGTKVDALDPNVLKDGRVLKLSEKVLTIQEPKTRTEQNMNISYTGEDLQIFRVGFGPDGKLYGSSVLPLHFLKADLGNHSVEELGTLGGGEVYSFLAYDHKLLIAGYSAKAPLMSYDPSKPMTLSETGNPALVDYKGSDHAWRPQAMIQGPDGQVYVGATAGYGKLEGPLLSWKVTVESIQIHGGLVHDQSVVSLAVWRDSVVCGTTTTGGGGSHPDEKDAHLVLWNTKTRVKELDVIPVPGAQTITDLVTSRSGIIYGIAVSGGIVFGIATPGNVYTLFAYDAVADKVVSNSELPFHDVVYNGIGLDGSGRIVGLGGDSIFTIDESSHSVGIVANLR